MQTADRENRAALSPRTDLCSNGALDWHTVVCILHMDNVHLSEQTHTHTHTHTHTAYDGKLAGLADQLVVDAFIFVFVMALRK